MLTERHVDPSPSEAVPERSDEQALARGDVGADHRLFTMVGSSVSRSHAAIAAIAPSRSTVVVTPHDGDAPTPTTSTTSNPQLM